MFLVKHIIRYKNILAMPTIHFNIFEQQKYIFIFSFQLFIPTTFCCWVSFSPVPECVVVGLLETSFPDPPVHQDAVVIVIVVVVEPNKLICSLAYFLEADYHYTAIFFTFSYFYILYTKK